MSVKGTLQTVHKLL